jgi:radical SAM superfamily enzyme YgiQ (UPF0313 family)
MPPLVLATLNARWAHASFGLRYLLANLGELRRETALLELEIGTGRDEAVARILALEPRLLGLGVYVWNVAQTTAIVAELKRRRPEVTVVLGGPEVSHEPDEQEIVRLADHVVLGEGDLVFPGLARALLAGESRPKLVRAEPPPLDSVRPPYDEYSDLDVAKRVVYVEASRGCPYACEFCLSSLDEKVRVFPLDAFLTSLDGLIRRGARELKFVDRTFNLKEATATRILSFLLERARPGLHFHFEMVPDRLPPAVRELAARFPEGSVQFEVGIQTFTPGVNREVSRFQDDERACANLRFLRDETKVNVHADLLFGLPGESLESFGASFDRLLPLVPRGEIQVGILKRLRGTPLVRHERAGRLVFDRAPPYEVLSTDAASIDDVIRVKRFARTFEIYRNSGVHRRALELLFAAGPSPFRELLAFSDWSFARISRTFALPLVLRSELLFDWLVSERELDPASAAEATIGDYYLGETPRCERLRFLERAVPVERLLAIQRSNRVRAHARASAGQLV